MTEQGTGPPLVLLHAFPLSGAMWQQQAGRFAPWARVIAPDLPGFGRSPRQSQPSIPAMARTVADRLDGLGLREPAILAGLSMGGYVAFEFLRQFPARVKALGLFSTKAAPDSPEQREGRFRLIERLRREGLGVLLEAALPKLVGATTAARRPEVMAGIRRLMVDADREGVIDAVRAMAERADSRPLLPTLACPTLILAGAEDALIPPQESEAMAQAIPGARLDIIPAAGHLVNLEQPEMFQERLTSWIRQVVSLEALR